MSKKYYRFFGGLLTAQEHWLNKMSEKGYRLIRAEKMLYEFEECKPDQVKYCVEFIGQKSKANASDYHEFLEGMGYKVFYKNINLNYSVGKVRLRPWAEKGGRIATNATTFNRELLIVEKDNDGKPFELHTSYEDKENYYRNLRNPWLLILLMFEQTFRSTSPMSRRSATGMAATSSLMVRTPLRHGKRATVGVTSRFAARSSTAFPKSMKLCCLLCRQAFPAN